MVMTNEDYLKTKGFTCPFCFSPDVEDNFPCFVEKDLTLTMTVKCGKCYKQWHEVYIFAYYSDVNINDADLTP